MVSTASPLDICSTSIFASASKSLWRTLAKSEDKSFSLLREDDNFTSTSRRDEAD